MHIICSKSACKAVTGHPLTAATQLRPKAIPSTICGARSYLSSISVLPPQYLSIKAPPALTLIFKATLIRRAIGKIWGPFKRKEFFFNIFESTTKYCCCHCCCSLCLQNNVLCHTAGNLPTCTPTHDLHVAFKIPQVYFCISSQNCAGSQQQSHIS